MAARRNPNIVHLALPWEATSCPKREQRARRTPAYNPLQLLTTSRYKAVPGNPLRLRGDRMKSSRCCATYSCGVAFIACAIPGYSAARVQPLEALHNE